MRTLGLSIKLINLIDPMKYFHLFILSLLLTSLHSLHAQSDSLILKNGDVIIGEIKDMDRGVLTIETDYSDSDFKIEWNGISEIHTVSSFLITLSDGQRFNGPIRSIRDSTMVELIDPDEGIQTTDISEIVFLNRYSPSVVSPAPGTVIQLAFHWNPPCPWLPNWALAVSVMQNSKIVESVFICFILILLVLSWIMFESFLKVCFFHSKEPIFHVCFVCIMILLLLFSCDLNDLHRAEEA